LVSVSGINSLAGAVSLSDSPFLQVAAGELTLSGILSGTGGFTKIGSGTLVLSGANTFAGATTVQSGILNLQTSTALGGTLAT
jgi:autotransporter-associated beta strand protein